MKRAIYFLICAFVICSCTKEVEIATTPPVEGEPMQFSMGSLTRASVAKTTWSKGDWVAVSRGTDGVDGTKIYEVIDSNGTLAPYDENDYWEYSFTSNTFSAIYPEYMDYTDLPYISTEDVIYQNNGTANNQVLTFDNFVHAYALLQFSITNNTNIDSAVSDVTFTITLSGESEAYDCVSFGEVIEFFILPGTYSAGDIEATITADGYEFPITLSTNTFFKSKIYKQNVVLQFE